MHVRMHVWLSVTPVQATYPLSIFGTHNTIVHTCATISNICSYIDWLIAWLFSLWNFKNRQTSIPDTHSLTLFHPDHVGFWWSNFNEVLRLIYIYTHRRNRDRERERYWYQTSVYSCCKVRNDTLTNSSHVKVWKNYLLVCH